jgi:hypothetical protein
MKTASRKKSNYLGVFIGALVVQLLFFYMSAGLQLFSLDDSASRLVVSLSVVAIVADIFCIYRIMIKSSKELVDVIALFGAYAPLALLLYYLYILLLIAYGFYACSLASPSGCIIN